jgi:hypothetical protein
VAGPRIDLLLKRAAAPFQSKSLGGTVPECDVVAQVVENGAVASYLYNPATGNFSLSNFSATVSDAMLRGLANTPGQEVTYTAWPPGSGLRVINSALPPRRRRPVHH